MPSLCPRVRPNECLAIAHGLFKLTGDAAAHRVAQRMHRFVRNAVGDASTKQVPDGLSLWLTSLFGRIFHRFLEDAHGKRNRRLIGLAIAGLITLSALLPVGGLVLLKMLPLDNKSEFRVIVDMPAGTPVEQTAAVLHGLGACLGRLPQVTDCQAYAGIAAPINLNGLAISLIFGILVSTMLTPVVIPLRYFAAYRSRIEFIIQQGVNP